MKSTNAYYDKGASGSSRGGSAGRGNVGKAAGVSPIEALAGPARREKISLRKGGRVPGCWGHGKLVERGSKRAVGIDWTAKGGVKGNAQVGSKRQREGEKRRRKRGSLRSSILAIAGGGHVEGSHARHAEAEESTAEQREGDHDPKK